jgi:histone acetyltransferase (RNA polymerase elongator complex component)
VGDQAKNGKSGNTPVAQHLGIGQRLLVAAENLAKYEGYEKLAVISGVGVRNYYERFGYHLNPGEGEFMIKSIHEPTLYETLAQFLDSLRIV